MRAMTVALASAVLAPIALCASATTATAQNYVYSTQYCARAYDGATDCAYYTLWQCWLAVSATGGDCAVNPRFAGDPPPRYRKARRIAR